ncbi:hypothetical protein DPMN_042681 [Dreissena polymorpha]|uniref:Uncharacterized protein n=1 Tax=Dreissena polymorpha TaxID=45954 RepID=A0A9D4HX45_DREPO|nr:hypothetical protein DPMN_042681 [Dreissena polymorpha]
MSQRRKLNVKLNGNDDKEKFQRETVRLLEQFFQLDIDEQVRFHSGDQENVSSQKPGGNLQKGAGVLTEDTDDIPQVFEDPRTELEQEIVHELRRIADDIDRNGNLKATVRQSIQNITGLLAYNSFTSAVQQYVENLVAGEELPSFSSLQKRT